jgi:hypothetical protein
MRRQPPTVAPLRMSFLPTDFAVAGEKPAQALPGRM